MGDGHLFIQAILAGAILSGVPWARKAHMAGLIALLTLRRLPGGLKLGLTLLALGAAALLQAALGKLSAHGANLLWVHVPLGVALIGLAAQAVAQAGRLDEPRTS